MKMNKKGLTLVEIIISVTLVSIVLAFLLNMLISVRTENSRSQSQSNLLVNQALIIEAIENDFIDYELQGVSACVASELSGIVPSSVNINSGTAFHCLKFTYNAALTTDYGYLLYYNYTYSDTENLSVIGYKRGDTKVIRETEVSPTNTSKGSVTSSCGSTNCALSISMPVYGEDGENYGINLSYIYQSASFSISGINSAYIYNFTNS